jgi:FkbM family methyltransferase
MIKDLSISEYEKLIPCAKIKKNDKEMIFFTPNNMTLWRAKTLFTKEPSTIDWLDKMNPNEHLLDVGANVGMYTVYAAKYKSLQVTAFEPEAQNFAILLKNIRLNNISEKVALWPVAISDKTGLQDLYVSEDKAGGSCHSIGEEVNFKLEKKQFKFHQGAYCTTIDSLVDDGTIDVPDYIKIDIDGLEHRVISGAKKTLKSKKIKSLSIEINTHLKEHTALIDILGKNGFKFDSNQTERSIRKDGTFSGVGEFIFSRI